LVTLDITIPGVAEVVYLVNNSDNITWKGNEYIAFPFELEELTDQSTAEVPSVSLKISNVSRVMDVYLDEYDTYVKANGYAPIEVTISVINTAVIAVAPSADAEVSHSFILKKPSADARWATFELGVMNLFNRRFPQNRILKNHCRYKFKDSRCGYVGTTVRCGKTLSVCRTIESGESTTIGSGTLTDTNKSWTVNALTGMVLKDSALANYVIASNTADTITVVIGSPTSGKYYLSNSRRFGGAPGVGQGEFETY
jgi:lambda family phage minor tail protein L